MAILTPADGSVYFPEVPLSGTALVSALTRAQLTAESAKGANRPLERRGVIEIRRVNRESQSCYLSRLPIALIPLPSIQVRSGGYRDGWNRNLRLTQWEEIEPEHYQLDYETGQLTLLLDREVSEVRASYEAGFDFSDDNDPAVQEIKTAVAAILLYQTAGR